MCVNSIFCPIFHPFRAFFAHFLTLSFCNMEFTLCIVFRILCLHFDFPFSST